MHSNLLQTHQLSPPASARCCPYLGRTPHSLPTASQPQPHSSAESSVASDIKGKKKKRFKVQKSHSASPFTSVKVMRREIVLLGSQQLTLRRRPKGGEKKSMKSLMMKRRETRSARLSSAPAPPPERLQDCAFFYSGNTLNRLKCKAVKRHLQNTSDLNATAPNQNTNILQDFLLLNENPIQAPFCPYAALPAPSFPVRQLKRDWELDLFDWGFVLQPRACSFLFLPPW